ncbi:hypothetical protein [Devosia beringensis]|uniref:hypothetical protein n=1 Tax=Devosia beringensis TaxID=2657486 RepID=UPI00186B7496|nr:hypothetical protein [Devosia beringensis]
MTDLKGLRSLVGVKDIKSQHAKKRHDDGIFRRLCSLCDCLRANGPLRQIGDIFLE